MEIFREMVCRFQEKPYLCTVFFMVLDFKVNKGWAQRSPFFMPLLLLFLFLFLFLFISIY